MKISLLVPQIYHVKFRSQKPLAKTFVRFQEYFESPHFRGRCFSLETFRHWYIGHSPNGKKTGRFTFYQDWGGFNIPSHVLDPFYKGYFDPLSREEQHLLTAFKDLYLAKFYLIGTYGNHTRDILDHEIAHALYYLNPQYRQEVLRVLRKIDRISRQHIYHFFARSKGYHHDVWLDEMHAYVMTLLNELKVRGVPIQGLNEIQQNLHVIYRKYTSKA